MKATVGLLLFSLLLGASWLAWQEYGFLFADIKTVDVSDIVLDAEPVQNDEAINLDFLSDSPAEPPLDLAFLDESVAAQDDVMDLSFLENEEPSTSANSSKHLISNLLDIPAADMTTIQSLDIKPICIFDPIGPGGDIYELIKAFTALALSSGVELNIKTFNSESVIVDSFKAGHCDGIAVTGLYAKPFSPFAASIEAVGGLPRYADLKYILEKLTQDDVADALRQGEYEVAAIIPVGNVYAFIGGDGWAKERSVLNQFMRKKVGVFEGSPSALTLIRQLGATPVMVNTSSFAGKFNNAAVDIIFSPAVAYQAMELYRGLGDKGVIVRYPLAQLSYQLIIRHRKFPADFAKLLRQAAYSGRGFSMEYIHLTEKQIPDTRWHSLTTQEQAQLENALLEAQQQLFEQGEYDPDMLTLMRKARCQRRPSHYECAAAILH